MAVQTGTITGPDGQALYYDGLPTSNFTLIFDRLPFSVMFLQDFQTPTVSVNVVERPTRFVDTQEVGEKMVFGDLQVTFLVDKFLKNYREVYLWMKKMTVNGSTIGQKDNPILLINKVHTIRFVNAWPKSLSSLNFKTNETDVIYITATATFNIDYSEFVTEPFEETT